MCQKADKKTKIREQIIALSHDISKVNVKKEKLIKALHQKLRELKGLEDTTDE